MKNKLKNVDIQKVLIYFIVFQPIIDVITSLAINCNINLSFGVIIRTIFLLIIVFYWLTYEKWNKLKKIFLGYLGVIGLFFILYILNIISKYGFVNSISEIQIFFRFFYFPILFITLYQIIKNNKININYKYFYIIMVLYVVLLLLPSITGTSLKTYKNEKIGTTGWFFSPNEVGAIIAILSSFIFDYLINKKRKIYDYIIFIIFIFVSLFIGTKVPFLGFTILIIMSLFYHLIKALIIKDKNCTFKKIAFVLIIIPFFFIIAVNSPSVKNIGIHLELLQVYNFDEEVLDSIIFSSRDDYKAKRWEKFKQSNTKDKLLGLGMDFKNTKLKAAENDYYDVFFNFGILGSIIYIIPFLLFVVRIISMIFKNLKLFIKKVDYTTYFAGIACVLGLSITFFAGHVLSAPAVSIYLTIAMIVLLINTEKAIE